MCAAEKEENRWLDFTVTSHEALARNDRKRNCFTKYSDDIVKH